MATLPTISPDKIEQLEIAALSSAVSVTLAADLAAAITAAGGTPPTSGTNLDACVAALVAEINTSILTALASARGINYTLS